MRRTSARNAQQPSVDTWRPAAAALADVAADLAKELAQAQRDLTAAKADRLVLQKRIEELQTWLNGAAQFDAVEHLQLGRMLALRAAESERPRLNLRASLRATALLTYAGAAALVAWLVISARF